MFVRGWKSLSQARNSKIEKRFCGTMVVGKKTLKLHAIYTILRKECKEWREKDQEKKHFLASSNKINFQHVLRKVLYFFCTILRVILLVLLLHLFNILLKRNVRALVLQYHWIKPVQRHKSWASLAQPILNRIFYVLLLWKYRKIYALMFAI